MVHEPSINVLFGYGPEELVRPIPPGWQPVLSGRSDFSILRIMPARFGIGARHVVFLSAKKHRAAWVLMPWLDAEVALLMADWLRTKSASSEAGAWFARHGVAAVPFLVPNALGGKRVPREKATAALSLIVAAHCLPAVVEAVERTFGDVDEQAATPGEPPKTPWLNRDDLPEVDLRDGRALPPDAMGNLIGALALSPELEPNGPVTMYPELDDALDRCDPASLAAFGRAILERWIAARRPSNGGWALDQLSRTADDDAVRRPGTLLLDWPDSGTYEHAVQVLRAIGTDTALMRSTASAGG